MNYIDLVLYIYYQMDSLLQYLMLEVVLESEVKIKGLQTFLLQKKLMERMKEFLYSIMIKLFI
jgi:hypothetical protein